MDEDEIFQYNNNLFYKLLQNRYKKHFEIIQEQNGLICLPLNYINEEHLMISSFVLKHLYIPSPFLKNQYNNISYINDDILIIDSESYSLIIKDSDNNKKHKIRILSEQIGYRTDNKSYRVLIIEYPLSNNNDTSNLIQGMKKAFSTKEPFSLEDISRFDKASQYLQSVSFTINECFLRELNVLKETYVIISSHLDEFCEKEFYNIHKKYYRLFKKDTVNAKEETLSLAIENYLNGKFYDILWVIIKNLNSEKDKFISFKIKQIQTNMMNGNISYYLKLNEKYLINYNLSIKEIKKIHLKNTVFEKLICMKTCFDLISTELMLHYKSSYSEITINDHELKLTSDEILPLTCFVILKANLDYLYSLIFFIEKFNISSINRITNSSDGSLSNELSFVFSTFKAAINLIEHFI